MTSRNDCMVQLVRRPITDTEPLYSLTFGDVKVWRDDSGEVVAVDLPAGFSSHAADGAP